MKNPFAVLLLMVVVLCAVVVLAVFGPVAWGHYKGCRSKGCLHWKRSHPWHYRWHHLSLYDRHWARCIAHWETYGIPWPRKATVVGIGGHLGAMQFAPATAVAAGFSRPVTQTTLHEQLVRGVWWRNRAGASQWATAGRC